MQNDRLGDSSANRFGLQFLFGSKTAEVFPLIWKPLHPERVLKSLKEPEKLLRLTVEQAVTSPQPSCLALIKGVEASS